MRHGSGDVIRTGALVGLLTLVVGCGTCQPGMKAFDVRVEPRLASRPDQPTPNSVEVNLVGVNQRDYARWSSYPVNQYWNPNDPLRREAQSTGRAHVMVLSADDAKPKVLARSDPIWSKWRAEGATHLLVLAFLPGARPGSGRSGGDPQRLIFPLDNCRWKGTDTLDVAVEPSGLTTRSTPQPEK
jgi:hypothetical protein